MELQVDSTITKKDRITLLMFYFLDKRAFHHIVILKILVVCPLFWTFSMEKKPEYNVQ